jgi:tetratricopeptide (TPR) repeat protein
MKKILLITAIIALSTVLIVGCSGTQQTVQVPLTENQELSLKHFLDGSLHDQKQEYAQAILEYQDALHFKQDPAIYHAMAKDYSILSKNDLAMQMGREAVRLDPNNRTYHETLAGIYINALELEGAIHEYESIIHIDSSYQEAWLNLARLLQIKQPENALKIYEKYVDRFGPDAGAYFQMAQIYSAMNNNVKEIEALKGMLASDPSNFDIKKILGDTYLRQDSVDAALTIYHDLVELHPESVELRAAIAHAYLVKQDYEHATEQFETVLRKDSLSVEDQLKFGEVFVKFIEKDSAVAPYAIKLFNKIQKTHPTDWRPYWFLGAINNVMRDDSGALRNFRKVKELASWNPDGWVGIAGVYYDRNNFDEAINTMIEAKKILPEEFRVHFLLGISYQRKHALTEAAMALEKAVQLNEKSVDALSALALVYDEMKRPEDSDTMYEHALKQAPHNHLVLNNYGYSLAERGLQLERAMKMSKEAVEQQPNNQSYLDTYGWIFYRMGNYTEAERYVRKAVELGNTNAVLYEHLGDINFKLDQKEKAKELWEKAFQLDSSNQELKVKIERGSL